MKREYTKKVAGIKFNFLKDNPDCIYSLRSKAEITVSGVARRRGAVFLSGASLGRQQQALARNGGTVAGGSSGSTSLPGVTNVTNFAVNHALVVVVDRGSMNIQVHLAVNSFFTFFL
ncbi:hypothetical protein K7432_009708 [Basidiobolus ranarum]|uniref:Uncharacterized protein n=1 Tax=Basidiobolus ranarum TaxID=34480 RepID=A0ABR2WPT1_9FUNG